MSPAVSGMAPEINGSPTLYVRIKKKEVNHSTDSINLLILQLILIETLLIKYIQIQFAFWSWRCGAFPYFFLDYHRDPI